MMLPTPSYTFVTSSGQRKFFHRWHFHNNDVIECDKCGTTCKETDAYSVHWLQQKTKLAEAGDELNTWQKTAIMKHQADIVSQNIESFMLCNGKAVNDTKQFLLDAGLTAIPDLLSVLFATDDCKELMVKLRFYVEIEDEMFMLQSSELKIKHHFDIRTSVDVIFLMLLEKLRTFMSCMTRYEDGYELEDCKIKRIHIQAVRKKYVKNEFLALPLQYQRKRSMVRDLALTSTQTPQYNSDLENLTSAYKNHLAKAQNTPFNAPFPCNLYGFQVCAFSLELYAVPYHISSTPTSLLSSRNYIIINDIYGNFRQLQEISKLKRFLHYFPTDEILCCSTCQSKYMDPPKYIIHKKLKCGRDFEILRMDKDFIEIHEKCTELMKCNNWLLYGIAD